jgi:hypothetical protein
MDTHCFEYAGVSAAEIFGDAELAATLPPLAHDLAERLGQRDAMFVLNRFGGRRIFIPLRVPDDDHRLVAALGRDLTARLVWHYGDMNVEVPRLLRLNVLLRNRRIFSEHVAGISSRDLTARHGVSSRHLRKIMCSMALSSLNCQAAHPMPTSRFA